MKTRISKMVLPFMAFFMAIAFAFAFDGNSLATEAAAPNYIFKNEVCIPTSKICNNLGNADCTDASGYKVWQNISETFCSMPLKHRL